MMAEDQAQLARDGYSIVAGVISAEEAAALAETLDEAQGTGVRRRGGVYAIRNLLETVPAIGRLARSEAIRRLVRPTLGDAAFAVRGILFDKTPGANWNVFWHQDLSVAVQERREVAGYGPWSEKAGVIHVQPPVEALTRMLTVRVHLDDCDAENGPLRVIPGSHTDGRLDAAQVAAWRKRGPEIACLVPRGGALLMRPLLLHASSHAAEPRHRRVVHIEFAAERLPGGLAWYKEL